MLIRSCTGRRVGEGCSMLSAPASGKVVIVLDSCGDPFPEYCAQRVLRDFLCARAPSHWPIATLVPTLTPPW